MSEVMTENKGRISQAVETARDFVMQSRLVRAGAVVGSCAMLATGCGADTEGAATTPNALPATSSVSAEAACGQEINLSANRADTTFASRSGVMPSLERNDKLVGKPTAVKTVRTQIANDGRVAAVVSELLSLREGNNSPDTLTPAGIEKASEALAASPQFAEGRVSEICEQVGYIEPSKMAVVGGDAASIQFIRDEDGVEGFAVTNVKKDRIIDGYVFDINQDDTELDATEREFAQTFKESVIIDAKTGEITILHLKASGSEDEQEKNKGGGSQRKNDKTKGQSSDSNNNAGGGQETDGNFTPIPGAKGDKGDDGKDGANGKDGKDGGKGDNGKDGADGKDGGKGDNGKDGADGDDGKDGKDGINGGPGPQGPQGPAGPTVTVPGPTTTVTTPGPTTTVTTPGPTTTVTTPGPTTTTPTGGGPIKPPVPTGSNCDPNMDVCN